MSFEVKQRLQERVDEYAEEFGLTELTYGSFEKVWTRFVAALAFLISSVHVWRLTVWCCRSLTASVRKWQLRMLCTGVLSWGHAMACTSLPCFSTAKIHLLTHQASSVALVQHQRFA